MMTQKVKMNSTIIDFSVEQNEYFTQFKNKSHFDCIISLAPKPPKRKHIEAFLIAADTYLVTEEKINLRDITFKFKVVKNELPK
jgi:hypothetical protein